MAVSANVDLLEVLVQEIEEAKKEVHYYILVLSNAVDIYFLSKAFLKIIRKKLKVATDEELKTLNKTYVLSEEASLWHTIFMLDSLLDSLSGKHFFAKCFSEKVGSILLKHYKKFKRNIWNNLWMRKLIVHYMFYARNNKLEKKHPDTTNVGNTVLKP